MRNMKCISRRLPSKSTKKIQGLRKKKKKVRKSDNKEKKNTGVKEKLTNARQAKIKQ